MEKTTKKIQPKRNSKKKNSLEEDEEEIEEEIEDDEEKEEVKPLYSGLSSVNFFKCFKFEFVGFECPFSHLEIATGVTPKSSASLTCVNPSDLRKDLISVLVILLLLSCAFFYALQLLP